MKYVWSDSFWCKEILRVAAKVVSEHLSRIIQEDGLQAAVQGF